MGVVARGELKDAAFSSMIRGHHADALLVLPDPMFLDQSEQIARLAVKHKLASVLQRDECAAAGGLLAYGPSLRDLYRHAATVNWAFMRPMLCLRRSRRHSASQGLGSAIIRPTRANAPAVDGCIEVALHGIVI